MAADVTGTWKAEFDTQRGLQKYTFTLKQERTTVTGKATVERDAELKESKVEGDTITFFESLKIQDNEIRITYTGKISGSEIKFTRKVGDFGSSEATAKREGTKAEAAATQAASTDAAATNAPQGRRGRGFGGAIGLKPDDKPAFPTPPQGFDKPREGIDQGKMEVVEYDSNHYSGRNRLLRIQKSFRIPLIPFTPSRGCKSSLVTGSPGRRVNVCRVQLVRLLEKYTRSDRLADCLRLLMDRGATLPDPILSSTLLNDGQAVTAAVRSQPELLKLRTTLACAFTSLIGVSLLHVAAEYGNLEAARALVDAGADVNALAAVDNHGFNGHTPLFHTVNSIHNQSEPIMRLLLAAGARPDVRLAGIIVGRRI